MRSDIGTTRDIRWGPVLEIGNWFMYRLFINSGAAWIAAIYATVSLLWIGVSDRVLGLAVTDPALMTDIQSVKGTAFVLTTAFALYVMIRLYRDQIDKKRQELEAAERHVVDLFEVSGIAEIMVDPETLALTSYNDEAARVFGTECCQASDWRLPELWDCQSGSISQEEADARIRDDIATALEGGKGTIEWPLRTREDGPRTYSVSLAHVAIGGTPLVRASFVDQTEQTKIERILQVLGEGLAPKMGHAFFDTLSDLLLDLSGAETCLIARIADGHTDRVDTVSFRVLRDTVANQQLSVDGTPLGSLLIDQQYVFIDDVGESFSTSLGLGEESGLQAFAGMPLFNASGGLEGLIAVMGRREYVSAGLLKDAMGVAAARAGAELERVSLETRLRNNEIRFRSLIDEASQGIVVHKEMKASYCNPAFAEMFGYGCPEDICALESITVLFDDAEVPRLNRFNEMRLNGQEAPAEYAFRGVRKDGGSMMVQNRVVRVPWDDGYAVCANMFDVTEAHELNAQLEESQEFLRVVLDSIEDGVIACDREGRVKMINRASMERYSRQEHHGLQPDEWLDFYELYQADGTTLMQQEDVPLYRALHGERVDNEDVTLIRDDGSLHSMRVNARPLKTADGRKLGAVVSMHDTTGEKEAEAAIRRSQRLESISQLTGGIAHDFNNLLGIVQGNLDLLDRRLADDHSLAKRVESARRATERGATLTKRLLSFSRQEVGDGVPTDINATIRDLEDMLSKALTSAISLEFKPADDLWLTNVDPGDLGDVVLNLALNARDAMPLGGPLVIKTSNRSITEVRHTDGTRIPKGDYVVLSVTDTGTGIPGDLLDRVFEPYFTTKTGQGGTGLGLSMVYAFAQRSQGVVRIFSEPGCGTTVCLYLPRTNGTAVKKRCVVDIDVPSGDEVVLIVDDEDDLRDVAADILGDLGYACLTASDGWSGLEVLKAHPEITLLITDVVMPNGLDGFTLAHEAQKLRPGMPVLLASGFPGQVSDREADRELAKNLLNKPYDSAGLAKAVRRAIDGAGTFLATPQSSTSHTAVNLDP